MEHGSDTTLPSIFTTLSGFHFGTNFVNLCAPLPPFSKALFDQALDMKVGQLSEVKLTESPANLFIGGAQQKKTGSYAFIRLEELTPGEEKSLEDVKPAIAQILLAQETQKGAAKLIAEGLLAKVSGGADFQAEITAYNATLKTDAGVKPVEFAESGSITFEGLLNNSIEGIGRSPIAAEKLLAEINNIDQNSRVASVLEINGQWAALVLKEKTQPNPIERDQAREAQRLVATQAARQEFFGGRWIGYSLFGPVSFDALSQFPSEIFSAISADISSAFGGSNESFVDRLLKSSAYRDQVVETSEVKAFFSKVN